MMRFFLHFYDLEQRAGIQRAICEVSNALVEAGHEVILFSYTLRSQVAYRLDDRVVSLEFPDKEPGGTGWRVWGAKMLWAFRQFGILRSIVRRYKPDVVIDHGTSLGLLYPFRTIEGVPFVIQRHFPVRNFPNGRFLYRILSILTSAKCVVALTEGIAKELREHGYRWVEVIPNPIPFEARPAPYTTVEPKTGLLMGRAGNPQKGFDIFLRALSLGNIPGWRFRIVGPGVDTDPLLTSLVRELNLGDRVELLPATSDPYDLIRHSACMIMPSRYEALPMVALECLSIGRPILGSDVDGLSDVVVHGRNGILFPSEDVSELFDSLQEICSKPDLLQHMAEQAPKTVQRFDRVKVAQKWIVFATTIKRSDVR